MNFSFLAKAVGAGVISFNLAALPILLPVSAQTTAAPSSSSTGSAGGSSSANTGSSNTADPNINPAPSSSNTGTGSSPGSMDAETSTTPSNSGNMTPGTTTAPGSSMSTGSNDSGTSSTGVSPDAGSSTSADSPNSSSSSTGSSTTSSEPNTTTEPSSQQTTPTREDRSNLGWLGLLGLIGLASLFRKPTTSSAGHKHMQTQLNAANVHLEKGVAQAGEGIGNFIDELKTDVNDFKERRAKAKEIKEIKNALGRPSTRVILDRQDNVILNLGDLITNLAIERARSADMLDVLLDSVDEQKPAINDEERSAPVSGEASLEEQENETATNNRRG